MQGLEDEVISFLLEEGERVLGNTEIMISLTPHDFFSKLVPYSFIKNKLDSSEHYLGAMTVSNMLTSQVKSQSDLNNPAYFVHMIELILNEDRDPNNIPLIKDYAEKTMLLKGFYPESFKVKPVAQTHFARKALCHIGSTNNEPAYFIVAENFEPYIYSLNYMRNLLGPKSSNRFLLN